MVKTSVSLLSIYNSIKYLPYTVKRKLGGYRLKREKLFGNPQNWLGVSMAFAIIISGWVKSCFWHFWSLEDADKPERGQRVIKRLKTVQHLEMLRGLGQSGLPQTR